MTLLEMQLFVCPLVFFAAFVDSIAGGGALITIPVYLFTGMPAQMAVGTNKFASAIGTGFSAFRFIKNGNYHLRTALETAVVSYFGATFGAQLALHVSDYFLRIFMIIVLPCVAIFVLFYSRKVGLESRFETYSRKRIIFGVLLAGLVVGTYDGFFGPGAGTFMILAFSTVMGFDLKRACGNAKIVKLISNIAALMMYISAEQVNYALAIPATFFCVLGNWIGSGMAIRNGEKFIRPMMFIVICLLMLKIGWDTFFS